MQHPLEPLRQFYLGRFRQGIAKARESLASVVSELLLEVPSLKHPAYCHRLYRIDVIGKQGEDNKIFEVNVDSRDIVDWRDSIPPRVEINGPLVWNGIQFETESAHAESADLIGWAEKWLDIHDDRYNESAEFQEVIHSITPPQETETGFMISIDFGSAPTTAFDELISILCNLGERVVVTSQ